MGDLIKSKCETTHSIQYNGCRYKGQEFPVLKISAKIRVKVGNPVLNQSGIRVKEWDSLMIFLQKLFISVEIIQVLSTYVKI